MYLVGSVRLCVDAVSEYQGEVGQRRGMYQYIHLKSLLTYIINYICIEHTLASNTISRTDPPSHKHRTYKKYSCISGRFCGIVLASCGAASNTIHQLFP